MVLAIASVSACVVLVCVTLVLRASASVNHVALGEAPRPVSFAEARAELWRPSRSYVGTLEAWVEASVGPQYTSAYVATVRVRPGAPVRKNDVLATLDCSAPAAMSDVAGMEARAIEARQNAVSDEATRTRDLLDGGFVSPNELEQKLASSDAERARLEAQKSRLRAAALEVSDCVLRAPFDGEVGTRSLDPGAFVHPGEAIVSVVDRRWVRFTTAVPERDYEIVSPGQRVSVDIVATRRRREATIARRAPRADPATRTVHVEVDLEDPERAIPVGTTGVVSIDVGEARSAIAVPLVAGRVRGDKAQVFVLEGDVARTREVEVFGERSGVLFLAPSVAAGTRVVTQGRALLRDGDRVNASADHVPPAGWTGGTRGGGGELRP
jgi:RND family efflux transporter MFP subunit